MIDTLIVIFDHELAQTKVALGIGSVCWNNGMGKDGSDCVKHGPSNWNHSEIRSKCHVLFRDFHFFI